MIKIDTIKTTLSIVGLFLSLLEVYADNVQNEPNINYFRTPEASAFMKYGEESVNEYTGTANISVPLYTIKSKDIEIPLVLRYDASGIKVEQEASWVGLGWDLSVGGCINYVCAGDKDTETGPLVDDSSWTQFLSTVIDPNSGTKKEYYTYKKDDPSNWDWMSRVPYEDSFAGPYKELIGNLNDGWGIYQYIKNGYGERDFYSVNILGKNFMFFLDPFTLNTYPIGQAGEEFKIETDPTLKKKISGRRDSIGNWKITDSNGYVYYFTQKDVCSEDGGKTERIYTSCWYLTNVVTPLEENIVFKYTPQHVCKKSVRTEKYDISILETPIDDEGYKAITIDDFPSGYTGGTQKIDVKHCYLDTIETSNQTVTFATSLSDYCSGRRLDSIKVVSTYDNSVIKKIVFSYSSFRYEKTGGNGPNDPNTNKTNNYYRLKLENVKETASSETLTTSFVYYEDHNLPSKMSCAQDYWGYYNGQENYAKVSERKEYTLMPTPHKFMSLNYIEELSKEFSKKNMKFADRFSRGDYMKADVLKQVVYPTGGYTVYEYEPNSILMNDFTQNDIEHTYTMECGGLRIKKISNYDNGGSLINSIRYNYNNSKGSTGVLLNNIETIDWRHYICEKTEDKFGGKVTRFYRKKADVYTITQGQTRCPDFYALCTPGIVGYSQVTKCKYDNKRHVEKYIITNFINNAPLNNKGKVLDYFQDFSNGKILRQDILDADSNLILRTNNTYDIKLDNHYAINMGYKEEEGEYNGGTLNHNKCSITYWHYPYILSRCDLQKTTTTEYCPDGSTISKTKEYSYNNTNHQVAQIKESASLPNQFLLTKFTYSVDEVNKDPECRSMVMKYHRLNDVVEKKTMFVENGKENCISTERTAYGGNAHFVPISSSTSVGNAALETRATYTYDGKYNIRTVTVDGKETIYIWSYNGQYPIAKIEGITSVDLFDPETSPVSIEEVPVEKQDLVKKNIVQAKIGEITLETDTEKIKTFTATLRKKVSELGGYVTTYTYKPLVGMLSETTPNGNTFYYEYDAFGRLNNVKDINNKTLKSYEYNYKK